MKVRIYIMENRKVKHGDIFCYDFGTNEGSIQNGIRPALVIQANNFNANSPTTVIAAITTAQKGMYLPSHIFLGERYGLDRPSTVMLEQLRTVNQDDLGPYIGTVEDHTTLNAISKALKKTYGLWFYQAPKDDVRCLCRRCLDEYRDSNEYIISRRDPFQKEKDPCDRCRHPGYDYVLKPRRK